MDRETFRNPGVEYRAVPFWSWNDWLEDGELVRQIDEMEKAGWGGFFMHSRLGLKDALHDAGVDGPHSHVCRGSAAARHARLALR